jgi:hypothetical protein
VSNKIIPMTVAQSPGRSALDEFLPELDVRRESHRTHVDPGELHLDPVSFLPQQAEAPLEPIVMESPARAQLWPMLAAAFVGVGVTILALVAFARFA